MNTKKYLLEECDYVSEHTHTAGLATASHILLDSSGRQTPESKRVDPDLIPDQSV
jgi:hypothetical protein